MPNDIVQFMWDQWKAQPPQDPDFDKPSEKAIEEMEIHEIEGDRPKLVERTPGEEFLPAESLQAPRTIPDASASQRGGIKTTPKDEIETADHRSQSDQDVDNLLGEIESAI